MVKAITILKYLCRDVLYVKSDFPEQMKQQPVLLIANTTPLVLDDLTHN